MSFEIPVAILRIEIVTLFFTFTGRSSDLKSCAQLLYPLNSSSPGVFSLSAKDPSMRYEVYELLIFYKMLGHILSENCVE